MTTFVTQSTDYLATKDGEPGYAFLVNDETYTILQSVAIYGSTFRTTDTTVVGVEMDYDHATLRNYGTIDSAIGDGVFADFATGNIVNASDSSIISGEFDGIVVLIGNDI